MTRSVNAFAAFYAQTISSTSKSMQDLGFTTDQLGRAKVAHITCETAAIRYRYDGVKPTTSTGVPLATDGEITIENTQNIKDLNFIAQSSDATINVVLLA